jgi:hypothetical protein
MGIKMTPYKAIWSWHAMLRFYGNKWMAIAQGLTFLENVRVDPDKDPCPNDKVS